jgi:hypothetical protein
MSLAPKIDEIAFTMHQKDVQVEIIETRYPNSGIVLAAGDFN